jgi:transcriptional regulator with XRE-family HTH domain
MTSSRLAREILHRIKQIREESGITIEEVEKALILGPGWISRFESGEIIPSIDILLALTKAIGVNLTDILKEIDYKDVNSSVRRNIFAEADGVNLNIHFEYAEYDAIYKLRRATHFQYEAVLKELRNGLSRLADTDNKEEQSIKTDSLKTDSLVKTYIKAVNIWPDANPSDLWWFLLYRAYCDPYNHPAQYARLNLEQSWKRTAGWALEEVLIRHYGEYLLKKGIKMFIARNEEKERLTSSFNISERIEPDKIDVLLTGKLSNGSEKCFGVVHVKSSFAERRTDDVPLSKALIEKGYASPLWTMDCKSSPSENPINRGELGVALSGEIDRRSAKRKDIEEDGYFSACFSYNNNTIPTPNDQDVVSRIYVCDFRNVNDHFTRFLISEWRRHYY